MTLPVVCFNVGGGTIILVSQKNRSLYGEVA